MSYFLYRMPRRGARVLAGLLLLLGLSQAGALAQAPSPYFYYFHNQKVSLTPDPSRVAVRFEPDQGQAQRGAIVQSTDDLADVSQSVEVGTGGLILLRVRAGGSPQGAVNKLNRNAGVAFAAPVFLFPNQTQYLLTDEFLVRFHESVSAGQREALHRARAARVVGSLTGDEQVLIVKALSPKVGSALALANAYVESGLVEYAEPNFVIRMAPDPRPVGRAAPAPSNPPKEAQAPAAITPFDPEFQYQWGLNNTQQFLGSLWGKDIRAPAAWDPYQGLSALTIAIIDEGVDGSHPDLASKMVMGYNATDHGTPSDTGPNDPKVDNHGTLVAGVAAAATNNGTGVAGVCWNCKIMPIKVAYNVWDQTLNPPGYRWQTTVLWLAGGINWAWQHAADVLNNSWTLSNPSPGDLATIETSIQQAYLYGRCYARTGLCSSINSGFGATVVFATGNEDLGTVNAPSFYKPYVVGVGASTWCDGRKAKVADACNNFNGAWGSNYGNGLDLLAPGLYIESTDSADPRGYQFFDGTSAAAPFVSGTAALILSASPVLYADQVANALRNGADYLINVPALEQGQGRLNAQRAIQSLFDLAITNSDGQSTAYRGQLLTYTQTFRNNGVAPGGEATVTVTLPPGLQYVSSNPAFTDNGTGTLTRNVGALPVGSSGSTQVTVRVLPNPPGTVLTVTASIATAFGELNTLDNVASDSDLVVGTPLFLPALLK